MKQKQWLRQFAGATQLIDFSQRLRFGMHFLQQEYILAQSAVSPSDLHHQLNRKIVQSQQHTSDEVLVAMVIWKDKKNCRKEGLWLTSE